MNWITEDVHIKSFKIWCLWASVTINLWLCLLLQVNIKSLEDVVRKYISLAESKTEAARAESHQAVVDIDDLDNPDTPER